jgi:hypothetical protein
MSTQYPDMNSVPGWAKLEQYAKDTWGDGGWNIVTNPSDVSLISNCQSSGLEFLTGVKQFPDVAANACVDDTTYTITPKG